MPWPPRAAIALSCCEVGRCAAVVNVSTVYRALEVLEELGVVRHTHFHDGVAQFERTDAGPHHHMLCIRCGSDFELDVDVAAAARRTAQTPLRLPAGPGALSHRRPLS